MNIVEKNAQVSDLVRYDRKILQILLKDRTTDKNIIWATTQYEKYGPAYKLNREISVDSVLINNSKIIQPRAEKSQEDQSLRSRKKAEVFTPAWICNAQNNLVDEQWFGRPNVFNTEDGHEWIVQEGKIEFPKGKKWQSYINANRLELSCGEAPYLVSRYDSTTGEPIPVKKRVGLLDRKLRIVGENTEDDKEWFKWAVKAYQSTYGYDLQGDNIILARQNLLCTFIDYYLDKFEKFPEDKMIKKIATIISWNIWQMDGLTYLVPCYEIIDELEQLTLFDFNEDPEADKHSDEQYCKIKDWKKNEIIEYGSLTKG